MEFGYNSRFVYQKDENFPEYLKISSKNYTAIEFEYFDKKNFPLVAELANLSLLIY